MVLGLIYPEDDNPNKEIHDISQLLMKYWGLV